jgi:hypothetical protein
MAGAVRAERSIILTAGIVGVVAGLASCIEHTAMFEQPRGCFVRIWFVHGLNRNGGYGGAGRGNFGQSVAHVALKTDRLLVVLCQMLAIVATETAGPILVPDVIRMSGPRQILAWENQGLIDGLEIFYRGLDFYRIGFVVIRIVLGVVTI